jgi:transcriptional regulator NrdR family protein
MNTSVINDINCPKCDSSDTKIVFSADISNSSCDIISENTMYICCKCKFTTYESFKVLNIINKRNDKLNIILENGNE